MELVKLLPKLTDYKKIVVTGSQRSGTTIATKILAKELNKKETLEEVFDTDNFFKFIDLLNNQEEMVIQAPCMSSIIHFLDRKDIAIVFMCREYEEIKASAKRIEWDKNFAQVERDKYFKNGSEEVGVMKKVNYIIYQKPKVKNSYELDYNSLNISELWVEKEKRTDFKPRQTEI